MSFTYFGIKVVLRRWTSTAEHLLKTRSYYYVYFIEELRSYKLSYKVMCTNTDDEVQAITVNARQ